MKQFFKFMFASFFGTFFSMIVAGILLFVIFFAMLAGVMSSAGKDQQKITKVEDNTVLHINLNAPIKDRTSENPFENFDFNKIQVIKIILKIFFRVF